MLFNSKLAAVLLLCLISSLTPGLALAQVGLADAFALSLDNDARLAAARLRNQATAEGIDQAKAQMLPNMGLSASYTSADYEQLGVETPIESSSINLNISQPVFDKRIFSGYERAKLAKGSADIELEGERQSLALGVAEAYLAILLADKQLALYQAETKRYKQEAVKVSAALELGLASKADLLDAKARNEEAMSQVINAQRQLEEQRLALQRRVGKLFNTRQLKTLPEFSYQPPVFDAEDWVERVARQNVNARLAGSEVRVADSSVKVEQADHFPKLNLQARVSDSSNEDYSIDSGPDARITLALEVPIYRGGYTSSRVRQALAEKNQASERLRDAHEQALLEAQQVLLTLDSARARIRFLRSAVKARQSSLEAAEESRKLGLKDLVYVLDAQANLYQARRELNAAIHEHLLNRAYLYSLAGELSEETLAQLDRLLVK
jgi:outer membrane protein